MKISDSFLCKNNFRLFVFMLAVMLFWSSSITAKAGDASEASKVSIVSISYDTGYIEINLNGNTKVYYTQKNKNTWYEVEGNTSGNNLVLDISWISEKAEYSLTFKGDINETEIDVLLPASNTSLKVSYNKVDSSLVFTNYESAANFVWRKSTSYDWQTCSILDQSKFIDEMEQLMVKGGKIIVRIPGEGGQSDTDVGSRPSKSITISIPKRANGPSVKVDTNKLTLNTTNAMEYKIYSVGGMPTNISDWTECEKKMPLKEMVSQVFATNNEAGKDVVIAIRKAATERAGYSKTTYVTIPGQALAPAEAVSPTISKAESKFKFAISNASSAYAFQYAVVKYGAGTEEANWTWKNITNGKEISFTKSSYPEGSMIYIRLKGVNQSNKTTLKLPSAYTSIVISYVGEAPEVTE